MTTSLTVLDSPTTCCSPITGGAMSIEDAAALAAKFKAMGDPTRLRLLSLVAAHEDGEACVCDLNEPLELTQPTVSHHLKILVDAGLLTRSKRGTVVLLRIGARRVTRARRHPAGLASFRTS